MDAAKAGLLGGVRGEVVEEGRSVHVLERRPATADGVEEPGRRRVVQVAADAGGAVQRGGRVRAQPFADGRQREAATVVLVQHAVGGQAAQHPVSAARPCTPRARRHVVAVEASLGEQVGDAELGRDVHQLGR